MTTSAESVSSSEKSTLLIGLAREAIERELGKDVERALVSAQDAELLAWLAAPAATFVTLTRDGRLRGCIGTLEARRALRDDVVGNACAAAFEDPRFTPLTVEELDGLRVEVSLLSPATPIDCHSEAELLGAVRPGVDGLVLECGKQRATFLPQVWGELPEPSEFLAALRRKARLESDFWSDEMRFWRYTVEKFEEG